MSDWSLFWKVFVPVVILAFLALNRVFGFIGAIKALWPRRAKPQLLDAQECLIEVMVNAETVWFELLVNNAGSKDCSVTFVKLVLPNGLNASLGYEPSTPLPKTIPAGLTERIVMYGFCAKPDGIKPSAERLKLQPEQSSIEGDVAVILNTGKIIKKKISFIIRHT